MTRAVFIMSRILGNNTDATRIDEILKSLASEIGIDPIILNFEVADYSNHIHPFNKFSEIFRTSLTAHKKLSGNIKKIDPDILFFNAWELLPAFYKEIKSTPTILRHDTTTLCHHELETLFQKPSFASMARVSVIQKIYKRLIDKVDFFLPMSSWAEKSLIQDFSVNEKKTLVTLPSIDTNLWTRKSELKTNDKPCLLFVGNDFARKGGLFLLKIYENHLAKNCSLTIVSNDKIFSGLRLPPGVKLIQGVTQQNLQQLISIYQQSDLLVHPTQKDWSSHAIIEAAATGLPAISTEIGGIKDLILPERSGILLPAQASETEWVQRILYVIKSPAIREEMSLAAREYAVKYFSYTTMKKNLLSAFTQVRR